MYHHETRHLLVNYYDVDARLGRTYVLTNAYTQSSCPRMVSVVPVYDYYHVMCDKFNRRLCHCTWPHKIGGRDALGDRGSRSNFAMSCMQQNVFNVWFQANSIDTQSIDFSTNYLIPQMKFINFPPH